MIAKQGADGLGSLGRQQMPGARHDLEPRSRDQLRERAGVAGRGLLVELPNEHQCRRGHTREYRACVVRDEAVDRRAKAIRSDPRHRPALSGESLLAEAGAGDRTQDGIREVRRALARVERGEAGRAPGCGRGAVEAEGVARRDQGERAHPLGVGGGHILGDHRPERVPDEMGLLDAGLVEQPRHGVGERREAPSELELRRSAVPRSVPGKAAVGVGQLRKLRVPGDPAAAKSVEEQHRVALAYISLARLAPGEAGAGAVDVAHELRFYERMESMDVRQRALEIVRELGPSFRERAPRHDREATFPFDNYADLREAGLLGLCIPALYGGLGAGYRDYMHVAAELGRFCPTTALTFNMHTQTVLWTGVVADELEFTQEQRDAHEAMRERLYGRILEQGAIHAQPLSEGRSKGALTGVTVTAQPTNGGFLVSGRKIFASLAGAASSYNVTCVVPGEDVIRFLAVAADAAGVTVEGDWDTLGMRGTDSRTLLFEKVFVPLEDELLPAGGFDQLAARWPHVWMTLTPTYVGLTRAVVDFVRSYLSAPAPEGASARRDSPQKQAAWAEIQILAELSEAIWERAVAEAAIDPTEDILRRALVATYTVMETAPDVAARAIRACGGTTILKRFPLEQHYRDARCGALMLPWSAEVCLARLGELGLQ